jgi:hypothetical protein
MKYTYQETEFDTVIRTDENGDMVFIPKILGNADYQAYLNRDNPDYGNKL